MPIKRYRLIIQYDGSLFFGWQLQPNKKTIQGEIEKAIQKIISSEHRIPIYGSGRTDTGVHANGQVAHMDINTHLNPEELLHALNGNLTNDIRIVSVELSHLDFQSRFDAIKREYRYQCYTGDSLLFRNQSWTISNPDNFYLKKLAKMIEGEHDFLSFCKYRKDVKNTKCNIYKSEWNFEGKMVIFNIIGNRFLHHMVRYIVGTMIAITEGKLSIEEFKILLEKPKKDVKVFRAPPQGLILEKVYYE